MKYNEKTIEIQKIYSGKIIDVDVHKVKLPNNNEALREIVSHPGAVAILPIDEQGRILFVKQYRKPVEEELLEIPAGKIESNESPENSALRELEEETGLTAENITYLAKIYTSPGFSNEIIYLYKAYNLRPGKLNLDDDEFIDTYKYTYEEAMDLIKAGEIKDAKTISSILLMRNY